MTGSAAHAFPSGWRRGVYEAIARRRDMRAFLPDPIPVELLARLLTAAHQAGSVGFSQPWNFIVVEDLDVRRQVRAHVEAERLRAASAFEGERREKYLSYKLEGILEAPVNVCVTCDRERFGPTVIGRNTVRDADIYSTCGAIQNLWLAARAEGVGVGWVSILEPARLRELLGIPAHVVPVGYLCVGFVESFPERPTLETSGWLPRLPLSELVFHDRWGRAAPESLSSALHGTVPKADEADAVRRPAATSAACGQLLIYTGQGKGKTTAALGLVFRALGRGLRVAVVQFIKGKWKTGERQYAETIPELTFLVMGQGFTWESDDVSRDKGAARQAWATSHELIRAGEHAIVVLDEITYAINYGFIELADVLEALASRPPHVHVVLTGRNAPEELLAVADLVTEMRAVKHPHARGIPAQPGIDF